ncbi:MAG: glycosyltransferase [Verrucomicrobia bacterium]|nr:MAG: glycosyltransferase [Verrucomicrobiota bacterium]
MPPRVGNRSLPRQAKPVINGPVPLVHHVRNRESGPPVFASSMSPADPSPVTRQGASPREAPADGVRGRVTVDGKFFRLDGRKFLVKGVAYGPFRAGDGTAGFADRDRTRRDFAMIRELGANVLRVYAVPPTWFLDEALEAGLRLLIDVPWHQQACFLETEERRRAARQAVRRAAEECARHPATFALCVANEIPPDIVRWHGPRAVEAFLEELIELVKQSDSDCPATYGNFPSTEFLQPREADFVMFNLYLRRRADFENYLARLQMLADTRPLVIGELGVDVLREGEAAQAGRLAGQIEAAFQGGAAGAIVFRFTDEWHRGGREVTDWAFGLTTRERAPRPAFAAVREAFARAPRLLEGPVPRVSVVVAAYNAARTLPHCLGALTRLRYPDYEVILVDDGSTDATPDLARDYPGIRYFRHERNLGLSAARNRGIELATGEIVAFTDADCRPDEDWLQYLVHDLLKLGVSGIGGHNLLPPDDSAVAAAVMAAPGGPLHVMLDDRLAEHVPGCNMAFWRSALVEVGGFDPLFRRAGDDVDLCWRLQAQGARIGFSPGGFVWHYRRSTLRAYLRQQHGYGEAEAWLERKHPGRFNRFGASRWRGRIYGGAPFVSLPGRPIIYHGRYGAGLFQTLYGTDASGLLALATSLEYHVLVELPLLVLTVVFRWLWPLAMGAVALPLLVSFLAARQVRLPRRKRRFWSRPVVALLFYLQPIVRGWARYQGRLFLGQTPRRVRLDFRALTEHRPEDERGQLAFLAPAGLDRLTFLQTVRTRLETDGWRVRPDAGWSPFDLEIYGSHWSKLQLTTAAEYEPDGRPWIRCRLRTAATLPGRLVFWALCGLALVGIGLVRGEPGPAWFGCLLPVAWTLWLRRDQRALRRQVAVFLRRVIETLTPPPPHP